MPLGLTVALRTAELPEISDGEPVVAAGDVVAAIAGGASAMVSARNVAAKPLVSVFMVIRSSLDTAGKPSPWSFMRPFGVLLGSQHPPAEPAQTRVMRGQACRTRTRRRGGLT